MIITIDNVEYPTPSYNGVKIYPSIEFSENYGTTATGKYAGDFKRVADNVEVTWDNLGEEDLNRLYNLFKTKIFFPFSISENPLNPREGLSFEARASESPISILTKIKNQDRYKFGTITITFAER